MKQTQKKITFLVFVMALLIISSCSKESSYQSKIVGRWGSNSYTVSAYDSDGVLLNSYVDNTETIWEFTSDGLIYLNHAYFGTYTIQDDNLTLYINSVSVWASIIKLTNSVFSFSIEFKEWDYEHDEIQYSDVCVKYEFDLEKLNK